MAEGGKGKVVDALLKNKGFEETEVVSQEGQHRLHHSNNSTSISSGTSQTDPSVTNQILSFSGSENVTARYQDGYSKLRSWTYSSLDLYKYELLRVLYPVFVHCFMDLVAKGHIQEARSFFNTFREDHDMMHSTDLQKLEGVLTPYHLEEMEFAHTLRLSKINIKICQYSYELLLQYLHKTECIGILGIINERINFQVSSGRPGTISDDIEVITLVSDGQDAANRINMKQIHWGVLQDSLEERLEKGGGLLSDSEKADGEIKDGNLEENKIRSLDGGKQGASIKKLKKDKVIGSTSKTGGPEVTPASMAPRVKPELTIPAMPVEVELSILEDIRNRVRLSSMSLPSVSFYTFVNAQNGLNCSGISHDGSMVAGGFSDSSVKVWDMAKLGQQSGNSILQGENGSSSKEHISSNDGRRSYTLLQGHAGPVYSTTFSPLGDFILSSSADSTIRLWSTKLNTNLVCYKGHNYPVWDVQFSPVGNYFASSSHDRTVKIWSMDRIHPLRILSGHLSDVDCLQWHASSTSIATGSSDKTVRLWDVQSGKCARMFLGHRCMILSLAMSPDGRYIASGDEDGSIMLWDLSDGRCVTSFMGHNSCVWTLAFSGEGSLLASGSADCTVRLWDVNTSTKGSRTEEENNTNSHGPLKTLTTKSSPVHSLRFSRRNLLFAAGVFPTVPS